MPAPQRVPVCPAQEPVPPLNGQLPPRSFFPSHLDSPRPRARPPVKEEGGHKGLVQSGKQVMGVHSQPGFCSLEEVVAAGAEIKAMGLGREGWEAWDSVVVAELGEQREHRKQLSHRG